MNLDRTIPQILEHAAASHPDRPAIVDDTAELSFRALRERARRIAKAIVANGFQPGDRFAIWAPNVADWVCVALAGQLAGGVLVPLNTRFKGGEAGDIVRRSGARLAFAAEGFLGVDYAGILSEQRCPALDRVVRLGAPGGESSLERFIGLGESVPDADLDGRIGAVRPTDLSDILYTSGTTGAPKGAMTTHGQNIAVFEEWSRAVGLSDGDRYLVVNPFFHSFGYKAGLAGGTVARRDHLSGNAVRCRTRAPADRAPPHYHAAGPADAVPVAPGPSRHPRR